MQLYTVYFIWKLLYMFRVVSPPIIRSAYNCIHSIWYLSHRYCYLPLSWTSWNWFECAMGGVRHPQHTQTDTVVCAPDDGWKYQPKHVEQFPDINKLCNVASCWIYEYIGILLGAHYILHISRIRVNHAFLSVHMLTPSRTSKCTHFNQAWLGDWLVAHRVMWLSAILYNHCMLITHIYEVRFFLLNT